ncbi:hypothetical protein Tco_0587829 [Tanacetum coccineum]
MGDENPIHTLGDYSKPSHEGYMNTIKLPIRNNVGKNMPVFISIFPFAIKLSISLNDDRVVVVPDRWELHGGTQLESPPQHTEHTDSIVDPGMGILAKKPGPGNRSTSPQDVPSTSDRRLIELKKSSPTLEQKVHLAATVTTLLRRNQTLTTSCEILQWCPTSNCSIDMASTS